MAAIVTGCLGAVGGKVGELILGQFKYLYCFRANITNLKNEAEKLNSAQRVVISGEVETWLQKSNEIKREIDGILNEVPNVGSGCFSLGARFSLSKRAEETTERLKELLGEYKFDTNPISLQRPPASMAIPSESTYNFDSRKNIEENIMTTLRGEDVKMMGIYGMGGLGKTTMAKRIMNRALEKDVIDEVAMAVVSQPVEELKIQLEIARSLGLNLEQEGLQGRAQKLHTRLSGPKRTLIILDDVWKTLKLKDLGIPSDDKRCKILFTSRNRDALSAMNVKIFGMEVLSERDSWFLFKEVAGTCVDDTKLNSIAKEVVSECAGLPIVLITVGAALKGEVHLYIWENALQRLKRNCTPDNIPEYIAEVYNPLKLSYDVLERKYQDVFLLCCLYPEDAHIPLESLTYFCMGLRLLEGAIGNVEEARNRIRALSKVLKSRSLLLDSERGDEYVRMHDVVRDVCIFIAKQEGYIGDHDHCTWISSIDRSELPMGLTYSNLRLLFFQAHKYWKKKFTLDNSFLQRTRDLSMICIERYSLVSLPHTTQKLINLNTLVLDSCQRVETLSVVGELVNLEILICRDCDSIGELPPEIKGLKRLKVLDLTECTNLQRIGRGIISSLVGLVELKMLKSFKKWEAEDREERENAGLKELGQLPNLRCLEIEIEDTALATENIRLSSEVDRFTIRFLYESHLFSMFENYLSNKKMRLKWEGASCFGDWIKVQLLRDTECLLLVANEVGLTNPEKKIRYLELGKQLNCYQIHGSFFDRLEELYIGWYKGSMSLFSSSIIGNLVYLTTLTIEKCWNMVKVIEEKEEEKEKVVSGAQRTTILFPKLHKIVLNELYELVSFCKWKCDVELPSLTEVEIYYCYNMQSCTLGPLNTPKLESVKINWKEFGGVKDLNDILQQQYINLTEEKQAEEAEKKKGGEEEQEREGETEEEQN